MVVHESNFRFLSRRLYLSSQSSSLIGLLHKHSPPFLYTQKHNYVDVYMKWKKDLFFDSIESVHNSIELKPLIALKNCIAASPDGSIPISAVSKRSLQLGVHMKVARFLRLYPSVFEEFIGPNYNLPWFRLTQRAIELDKEERAVYKDFRDDIQGRLKKFLLMSGEKRMPLKIIQGMQWYLGLPDEYLEDPESNLDGCFRIVQMKDGLKGLAVDGSERVLSVIQRNAMRRGGYSGEPMESIEFPLFPSKDLRLKRKIANWFDDFQKLPYVSPYEDYSGLESDSDVSEKRVVGVLHELHSLFVEHAAERKKLLCIRKYLGLPQKFHKVFERHPYIFYKSLMNKTCTTILKEAYCDRKTVEVHPLSKVRKKYIGLMKESAVIIKRRRLINCSTHRQNDKLNEDIDSIDVYRT